MIDMLVMKSYDYLMQDVMTRIEKGKHYDDNFKSYSEDFIRKVINYFESKEEYEKCKTLIDFINIRYNHDLNYNIIK